jgi:hypothetical protein
VSAGRSATCTGTKASAALAGTALAATTAGSTATADGNLRRLGRGIGHLSPVRPARECATPMPTLPCAAAGRRGFRP